MNTLHELWQDAEPRLSTFCPDSPRGELMRELAELSRQFHQGLPPEKVHLWESLSAKQSDLSQLEKEEVFLYGVRLGAGFMLELLEPSPPASRP